MESLIRGYGARREEDGYRFVFRCYMCGSEYKTRVYKCRSPSQQVGKAAAEARSHFNKCHSCGRWVCDRHYNEDVMECVCCTPLDRGRTGD